MSPEPAPNTDATIQRAAAPMPLGPFTLLATLILLLAAVLCGFQLRAFGILTEHEALVAQTAREMTQRGDWIVPTFGGEPRLRKTPLPYWLAAAAAAVHGRFDEFAARLPSALAGIGTVAVTLWLGVMLCGRRVGLVTGLIAAASLGIVWHAHQATADIHLAFWCALSLALAWRGGRIEAAGRRRIVMAAAYVAFAFGMYAKGPMPVVIVGAPLVLLPLVTRRPRELLRLHPLLGIVVVGGLFLPWVAAVYLKVPHAVDVWQAETVGRMTGTLRASERAPVYYYLPRMLILTLPWSLSVFEALAAPFLPVYRERRRELLFCWLWLIVGLVFFSASPSKKTHYLLPLLPAMCVLLGAAIDRLFLVPRPRSARLASVGAALIVGVLAVGGAVGIVKLPHKFLDLRTTYVVATAVCVVGVAAAGVLYVCGRRLASLIAVPLAAGAVYVVALPRTAAHLAEPDLILACADAIRRHVPHDVDVFWLMRQDAPVLFYADLAIPQLDVPATRTGGSSLRNAIGKALDERLRSPQPVYVVMEYWHYDELVRHANTPARLLDRIPLDPDEPGGDFVIVTNASPPSPAG